MEDFETLAASELAEGAEEYFEEFEDYDVDERGGKGDKALPTYTQEMAKEAPAPLTEEELYERGQRLFLHNPLYHRVFLEILNKCDGSVCALGELEEFVAGLPGYSKLKNPPYFPVSWLRDAGALEELYLDAEGKVYRPKDVENLTEDELDDLVDQYAFGITELGRKLSEEFSPKRRLAELLEAEPARKDTYLELLDFLRQKHGFADIQALLEGRDVLVLTAEEGTPLQPSLFIDKLNETGAVAFDGGWMITAEGKEMLDSIRKE